MQTHVQPTTLGAEHGQRHDRDSDRERELAEAIVREAIEQQDLLRRQRAGTGTRRPRRQRLPGWVPPAMRLLARSLLSVAALNLLLGLLSIIYPLLVRAFGTAALQPVWTFYGVMCPQRPSHTWFIDGLPMAMEQRMVSMYVAFGVAGLLYCARNRRSLQTIAQRLPAVLRQPLPFGLMLLGIAPACIDVALSTAGILPSTGFSRLWTGALGSLALVAWGYPRYDAALARTQTSVARIQARIALETRAEPVGERGVYVS